MVVVVVQDVHECAALVCFSSSFPTLIISTMGHPCGSLGIHLLRGIMFFELRTSFSTSFGAV